MIHLVKSASAFAVMVSGPPDICTPKPNRMEATISGSIARRESNSLKSGLVKKLTIRSPVEISVAFVVSVTISETLNPCGTILMTETTIYIMMEAIAAVDKKVIIVVPITFPARESDFIFAIAEAMEAKTIGTTPEKSCCGSGNDRDHHADDKTIIFPK